MKKKKDLGNITFGKSRKAPPMVEVDVHFDKKCGDNLYKYGLKELKKDRKAVINYIIVRALTWFVKGKK